MKILAIASAVFVAAVYAPDVGRGFVRDDFTARRTLHEIEHDLPALPFSGAIVLHEDPDAPVFREVFSDLASEALRTRFGRDWEAWIQDAPAPPHVTAGYRPVIAEDWIRHGTITRAAVVD